MTIHTFEGVARCPACGEPLYADAEHECVISYEEMAKSFIAGEEKIEAAIQRAEQSERASTVEGARRFLDTGQWSDLIATVDGDLHAPLWRAWRTANWLYLQRCKSHEELQAQYDTLRQQVDTLRAALQSVAALGGNLTDERMERVGGENEGRDRALKFIQARRIAREVLAATAPETRKE